MKMLLLSDIHSQTKLIANIGKELSCAEIVVISGDITNFGGKAQTKEVIGLIEKYNSNILAVGGNCDLKESIEYLESKDISLHNKLISTGGFNFAGTSGVFPSIDNGDQRVEAFKNCLNLADKDKPLIVVTHQPAYATKADMSCSGGHCGNKLLRRLIDQKMPTLAISGHIHEAIGYEKIDQTIFMNPGPACDGYYATVEIDASGEALAIEHYRKTS